MRLERSANAKKNLKFGTINRMALIIMPFLVRTVMIRELGMKYVGLQGLYGSILSLLSVAELGFGSAIVYSMYKPVAEDDDEAICAFLNLYRKIYRIVGLVIFLLGCMLIPFLRYIVNDGYPEGINIYIIYFLFLTDSTLSYFMFAYRSSILHAFQRNDILSNVETVTKTAMSMLQIIVLYATHDFYLFLMIPIISTIANNLMIRHQTMVKYGRYVCRGAVADAELSGIKKRVAGLFAARLCAISRNAFDSVFISMFVGLSAVGIYHNYYYIMTAVISLLAVVPPALMGGIGNSIQLDTRDKNREDMMDLDFIYMIISGWCAVCLLCLYQPFIELWAGKENLMGMDAVVLFTLYFYVRQMGNIRAVYSDAAGLFWENRYRTICEAALNLILNYIFVRIWGVNGVIAATIIALFIFGFAGSAGVLYRCYFGEGLAGYFIEHLKQLISTAAAVAVTYYVCSLFPFQGMVKLFVNTIICLLIPPVIYLVIFSRTRIYASSRKWLLSKLRIRQS